MLLALAMKRTFATNFHALNETIRKCKTAQEIERVIWQNKQYNAVNLATAFNQLKFTKSTNPQSINRLLNSSSNMDFDAQALSVSCHSIAAGKLFHKLPQVFIRNIVEKHDNLSAFSPQALSSILWSLATLQQPIPAVISAFSQEIATKRELSTFKPQDISDLLWSYAVLLSSSSKEVDENAAISKLMDEVSTRKSLDEFKPRDLANIATALHDLFPGDKRGEREMQVMQRIYKQMQNVKAMPLTPSTTFYTDQAARAFQAWGVN